MCTNVLCMKSELLNWKIFNLCQFDIVFQEMSTCKSTGKADARFRSKLSICLWIKQVRKTRKWNIAIGHKNFNTRN